jgi:spore coat protein U-like protein
MVDTGAKFDKNDTAQTLNFGTMTSGKTLGFDIVLKHNDGYKLSLASSNSGKMKRLNGSQTVSYILKINGSPVSFPGTSSILVATGLGKNPTGGTRLPVSVSLGNLSTAAAGNYRDVVSVTVAVP